MSHAPLSATLSALREWSVARAWLDGHLESVGPAGFALNVEPLFAAATSGGNRERDAIVVLASWVAHGLALGRSEELLAIGSLADPGAAPRARAAFGDRPRRTLPPRGRLAEVDIATYADISGLPHRWPDADVDAWRRWRAEVAIAPARRRWMIAQRHRLDRLRVHHDPRFVARLLDQRWVSARDVIEIAARRPTVPAIVLAIATRDRWLREAGVRAAIADNPFAPAPLAAVLAAGTACASRPAHLAVMEG